MITDCFDIETEPIINVSDFCGEKKHLVDVCLIIYSWEIQEHLLNTFECEKIGELGACNGRIPIYKIHYKGKDVAFYLTGIGSAVAATQCYEASWLMVLPSLLCLVPVEVWIESRPMVSTSFLQKAIVGKDYPTTMQSLQTT